MNLLPNSILTFPVGRMQAIGKEVGGPAPFVPPANSIYFKTTSTSASYTFSAVTKTGGILTWTIYSLAGVQLLQSTANKPTFNLSTHPGTKWIVVTSPDGWSGLTILTATAKLLTLLNVDVATSLTSLSLNNNQIVTLNLVPLVSLSNNLTFNGNVGLVPSGLSGLIFLTNFSATGCSYSAEQINSMLADFVLNEAAGDPGRDCGIDLSNNTAPTGQGLADVATLLAAGWGVTVDP